MLGEELSLEGLREFLYPKYEEEGALCNTHFQWFEAVRLHLEKIQCAVCQQLLPPQKKFGRPSSSFNEGNECSRLLAVEALPTMLNVTRPTQQEVYTFLDYSKQSDIQTLRQKIAGCDSFQNSVFSLRAAQPNSLQSYLSCSFASEDGQEIRALNVLRNEFSCAKCFIMMKCKFHPDLK